MNIVWDAAKDVRNRRIHRVSFRKASTLFTRGGDYLEIFDDAHSDHEDRFIAIGPIQRGMILVVYTEREPDITRIISARWAMAREAEMYRSYIQGERQ